MKEQEENKIAKFVDGLRLDESVTPEEFLKAVKSAYQDRTRQIYFIWKAIKELHPEIDADEIIRRGSHAFGRYQGNKIKKAGRKASHGSDEILLGQTTRSGYMVFKQHITQLSGERAEKEFMACPHAEALEELGLEKDQITRFCRDMLIACDYGIVEPFEDVEISFPSTVADGQGEPCRMIIERRKE